MRYTLHAANEELGASNTAQGVADMAQPATVSFDSMPGVAFSYVSWSRESIALLGTPHRNRQDAFDAAASQRGDL